MNEDLKKAVAERLAKKELEKEKEKEKLKEAVRKRVLEEESKKTYQETPYGVFGVREGVYETIIPRYREYPSISPPLKFVASDIPNFGKFMAEGKIKKIAGKKSIRSRKTKNKKNRSTRRR